jgi:long-subunit acyl-CoA synthetase (AMP-forming)
MHLVGVKER